MAVSVMPGFIISNPPRGQIGTCELCGGHNRQLRIMVVHDFVGWVCMQCVEQVGKSMLRMYIPASEQTEPVE